MRTIARPQHEVTTTLTSDDIAELVQINKANNLEPSILVTNVPARIINAIAGGGDYVILTSADRCAYLGEVQDWDNSRMELVVELH